MVVCGRRLEPLEETVAACPDGRCLARECDIREEDQVDELVDFVLERHGRIDVLVNNAGGQFLTPAEDITPKGFRTVIRLNVEGTWLMSHAVATKAMIPGGGGKIVNVTLSPHNGMPGMAHSSAARAAVENLTRVLSIEWARFGVTLTAIAAGHFATETLRTKYPEAVVKGVAGTVPLGRLGTEEEFAWMVAFLALAGRRLPLGLGPHDRRRPRQLVRPLAPGGAGRPGRQAAGGGAQAEGLRGGPARVVARRAGRAPDRRHRRGRTWLEWGLVCDMRTQSPNHRDGVVGGIADAQHGVASRAQLLAAGLSGDAIGRALRAGRLHSLFRGVYAVGHLAISREAWWQAALLACGEGAVLSHQTAAQLWDLRRGELFPISVIVSGDRGRKHRRIQARRTPLDPADHMKLDGLAVTTPARTIVDLAGELGPRQLRELVERAQDLRRFNPREIRAILERQPRRRPGGRALLDFIDLLEPDRDGARSRLERLFPPARSPSAPAQARGERGDRGRPPRLRLARPAAGGRGRRLRLPLLAAAMRRDHLRDRRLVPPAGDRPDSPTRTWRSTRRRPRRS